jgi:hypothetical protein
MLNRYIYYRVPEEKTPLLLEQVRLMFRQIQEQTSVSCELARRAQADPGFHTWMEIYYNIPDDFAQRLPAFELAANLACLIVGARHVDDFLPIHRIP